MSKKQPEADPGYLVSCERTGRHNKQYANVVLTSYPVQRPWRCKDCDATGRTQGITGYELGPWPWRDYYA